MMPCDSDVESGPRYHSRMAARVLRCITRLNVGGPTRHVALLMAGLDPDRWSQVLVHGTAQEDEGAGRIEVPGVKIHVPDLVRPIAPLSDRRARARLRGLMRAHAPAIVHTHQGKAGALGRLEAARNGVSAIVHTYHGHTFEGYFPVGVRHAVRWMERRAAAASHVLICQSPSQESDVLAALGGAAEGKTRVIPPAIDPTPLENPAGADTVRRDLDVDDDALLILVPARLVAIKRPRLALRAFAKLRAEAKAALVFAGDGPLLRECQDLSRALSVMDDVRFQGYADDLPRLYRAADVTLLTSRMEGTPLALLEAMAAGSAVVCSRVGGVEDLVGDHGDLVDVHAAPGAWARAILAAAGRSDAARRSAGRMVRERHAPERLIRDIDAIYGELL